MASATAVLPDGTLVVFIVHTGEPWRLYRISNWLKAGPLVESIPIATPFSVTNQRDLKMLHPRILTTGDANFLLCITEASFFTTRFLRDGKTNRGRSEWLVAYLLQKSSESMMRGQAARPEIIRVCFLGALGPGCSKRNWVRSLMACAHSRPFCRHSEMVLVETSHACAISEMAS
jgi:hypothetical protein